MQHVSENPRVLRIRWKALAAAAVALLFFAFASTAAPAVEAADATGDLVAQDATSASECEDAVTAEGSPGDECCEHVAAAEGWPGEYCCDDDSSAVNGSHYEGSPGDPCCEDAGAATSGPGDDCDHDPCDDAQSASGDDDDCPVECPTPPASPADGGDDDEFACKTEDAYARIVSLPAVAAHGLPPLEAYFGEWRIGEVTYTVTTTTILERDYGGFAIDKCVEVTWPISYPTFALKIETKPDYKCGGSSEGDNDQRRQLFGAVASLPDAPDLLGIWTVGEISFTVAAKTELKPSTEAFTVGTFIKANLVQVNGALVAHDVKAIWANDDDDDDHEDDHWDWWKWRKGRAFGPIESVPVSGTVGSWVIAGVAYSVTERTRLDDDDGALIVGANVKVEYWKTRAGDRVAHKIESTDDTGNGGGQFRFVGVVDSKPTAFVGDWTIGGAAFVADASTVFDERKGLLVVDAYVSVRYVITDDMRIASEIRTVVPPGGGSHHHFGWIERRGHSTSTGVLAADGASANTWRIGGIEYVVTPATLINDDISALEEGELAIVNAYAEADGTLVATSIDGTTQDLMQFLPMVGSQ